MAQVTMEQAERLIKANVTEQHLFTHARAVSAAMGAMAEHFGEDKAHWEAVGYLHDVDYEKFPEEHLAHTRELLSGEDIDESDIRAILSHGYGICTDIEPQTYMEKSLFTVDELTGIVQAASLMRPRRMAVTGRRSSGTVTLRLSRGLSTHSTRPPMRSTSEESSVPTKPSANAAA